MDHCRYQRCLSKVDKIAYDARRLKTRKTLQNLQYPINEKILWKLKFSIAIHVRPDQNQNHFLSLIYFEFNNLLIFK